MKRLFESIELEKMFIRIQWQTYGWTHACDRLCDHENHMWFRKYPLLLYLSISDSVFGCIFGQHDKTRKKERAMYYISKRFIPYESRYTLLESVCCALTWLAQSWDIICLLILHTSFLERIHWSIFSRWRCWLES